MPRSIPLSPTRHMIQKDVIPQQKTKTSRRPAGHTATRERLRWADRQVLSKYVPPFARGNGVAGTPKFGEACMDMRHRTADERIDVLTIPLTYSLRPGSARATRLWENVVRRSSAACAPLRSKLHAARAPLQRRSLDAWAPPSAHSWLGGATLPAGLTVKGQESTKCQGKAARGNERSTANIEEYANADIGAPRSHTTLCLIGAV